MQPANEELLSQFAYLLCTLVCLVSACSPQDIPEGFARYEAALNYLKANPDLNHLEVASATTCTAVPSPSDSSRALRLAVFPEPVYHYAEMVADFGRLRHKACREMGVPLMSRTSEGVQFALEGEEAMGIGNTFKNTCSQVSQLSSPWRQRWKNQFSSTEEEVAAADWLVYFSPLCGDTLLATIEPHWDKGGAWSYHFHFTFDSEDNLDFVGISSMHSQVTPIPLKGWPEVRK